ncbi:hypothetical protein CIB84_016615 [Bambusicola thoracicus]|uniref:Uncharacterized protein n=1 Tax=Bambusicola thoracicus TaxID=9083 RepID=A0A2P4S6C0_BAMTH|nr:hypothetical protein CIB84_016615 [Bambusicola thoracicus]
MPNVSPSCPRTSSWHGASAASAPEGVRPQTRPIPAHGGVRPQTHTLDWGSQTPHSPQTHTWGLVRNQTPPQTHTLGLVRPQTRPIPTPGGGGRTPNPTTHPKPIPWGEESDPKPAPNPHLWGVGSDPQPTPNLFWGGGSGRGRWLMGHSPLFLPLFVHFLRWGFLFGAVI